MSTPNPKNRSGRSSFIDPYASLRVPERQRLDAFADSLRRGGGGGSSLSFSEFAAVMERLLEAGDRRRDGERFHLLSHLFASTSQSDDPPLERYALLKLLLVGQDRDAVFGVRTTRLLKSWGAALGATAKLAAERYLEAPQLVLTQRTRKEDEGPAGEEGAVCTPEYALVPYLLDVLPKDRPLWNGELTVRAVAAFLQRLTDRYMETALKGGAVALEIGAFASQLTPRTMVLLSRLLLREVPFGATPNAVLQALDEDAPEFYRRQRDIPRLCAWSLERASAADQFRRAPGLHVGVPFTCMTCETVPSPYMTQWLFARDTYLPKIVSPLRSFLFVKGPGAWYVPTLMPRTTKNRPELMLLDVRAPEWSKSAARGAKAHIRHLRRLQAANVLDDAAAAGLLLEYSLSAESRGPRANVVLLIRRVVPHDAYAIRLHGEPEPTTTASPPLLLSSLLNPRRTEGDDALGVLLDEPKTSKTAEDKKKKSSSSTGFFLQEKLDGMRLQLHVLQDGSVELFTRHGKHVTGMYGDIVAAAKSCFGSMPLILDGEVLVVDEDNAPLPWTSAMWLYDSSQPPPRVSELQLDEQDVVALCFANGPDEPDSDIPGGDGEVSIAAGTAWTLGATHRHRARGRVLPMRPHIRFVFFDVLLYNTSVLTNAPYTERWKHLQNIARRVSKTARRHLGLIEHSKLVSSMREVCSELKLAVARGMEGLVLKDPNAPYFFKRSAAVQKLKLRGPDINAVVLGGGFRLQRNPRRFQLVAGIATEDRTSYLFYCTVQFFAGAQPSNAIRIVAQAPSRVSGTFLRKALSVRREVTLQTPLYEVRGQRPSLELPTVVVRWTPKNPALIDPNTGARIREHTSIFWAGIPSDVQFLVVPTDCLFAMSLSGDLRPLTPSQLAEDTSSHIPALAELKVPRFPVARFEVDLPPELSEYADTPQSAHTKFEEARDVEACIDRATTRLIRRMRGRDATPGQMADLRKVLLGRRDAEAGNDAWPKPAPDMLSSVAELDALLVSHGEEKLSRSEALALFARIEPDPVWRRRAAPLPKKNEVEETRLEEDAGRRSDFAHVNKRLEEFRRMRYKLASTVMVCGAQATLVKDDADDDGWGWVTQGGSRWSLTYEEDNDETECLEDEWELSQGIEPCLQMPII